MRQALPTAGIRPVPGEPKSYWRMGHFVLPFYTFNVPGILTKKNSCIAWVPLDDENTMVVNIGVPNPEAQDPYMSGIGGVLNGVQRPTPLGKDDPYGPRIQGPMANQFRQFLPDTSTGLGRFRPSPTRTTTTTSTANCRPPWVPGAEYRLSLRTRWRKRVWVPSTTAARKGWASQTE